MTVTNLLSRCEVDESTGCWEWQDYREKPGYGKVSWNGELWRSHRLSYTLHVGEIPDGMCVLHKCDNPPCINPDHLFLGTRADNKKDCVEKGRAVSLTGENHGRAKLSTSEVLEIKHRYESEDISQTDLGAQYGIGHAQVSRICRGKQWRNINDK